MALEGPLDDAVQVFDPIPKLQIYLLQSLNVVINNALLLVIIVVFHLVFAGRSLRSVHRTCNVSYHLVLLNHCLIIVHSGGSTDISTFSTANEVRGHPSELIFVVALRLIDLTSGHILLQLPSAFIFTQCVEILTFLCSIDLLLL